MSLSAQKIKKTGRPLVLDPFFRSVRALSGVGPKIATLIENLCGSHYKDLLFHIPTGIVDRGYSPPLSKAENGRIGTFTVTIINHIPTTSRSKPYRVRCQDDHGDILDLVFFHARKPYLLKLLPLNEKRVISGRIDFYQGIPQIMHPDHIGLENEKEDIQGLEPTYPLTTGLSQKVLRKHILSALKDVPALQEWHDEALIKRNNWPSFYQSLSRLHRPQKAEDIYPESAYRIRLAYDEILSTQLTLALNRHHNQATKGRALPLSKTLKAQALTSLPFSLTAAQQSALHEIEDDIATPKQMLRLLQGDVGSGKTIVAFLAALHAIEQKGQAVFMAPTEILARQHYEGLSEICDSLGISYAILTSREKGKARAAILEDLASGQTDIIFGTHALFQDHVIFNNLQFAVIDEQHRFGVHQRMQLTDKGNRPDILVMTATPIPRTLTLTVYGDMDVSRIGEKPPGRKDIDTRLLNLERLDALTASLKNKVDAGEKIYWVCPLVEESEKLDLAAAQDRYEYLCRYFPAEKIGLVHGQMKGTEKDAVMDSFKTGAVDILVATTVIEVGVNVPAATVMIVEHAERFGLSQLHQLRGRIGRGDKDATCLLLYPPHIGETAKKRLETMRETNDGFLIAEKDLQLRGAGEMLGVRQSGEATYALANIFDHQDLITMANKEARLIVEKDPHLQTMRGEHLRELLYLFERDKAITYLRSG